MRPLPARVFGESDNNSGLANAAYFIIVTGGVCSLLYFGKEVLLPVALAILLTFILAPVVRLLQRCRLPKAAAILLTVLLAFSIVFAVGSVIALQVNQLATDLPQYEQNLREKIRNLRLSFVSGGTLESTADLLNELGSEINRSTPNSSSAGTSRSQPLLVEVREPEQNTLEKLSSFIIPLLHPLVQVGIVILFVVFILFQREDLRNRFIRMAGVGDLQRTTDAFDDAGSRLSRLFILQALLNASFGIFVGISLWLLGVPGAILWGVLTAFLRFIPYAGSIMSAVFPVIIATAVSADWTLPVATALVFIIAEPIVGHVIEPLLFGHSTGLSPFAVVVSAIFWTSLWGPMGLVLATPLTICLVVLGRHIESLKFLEVIFGSEPALRPEEMFYQRMLAGDQMEAVEQAEDHLKDSSLSNYIETIAVPGLLLGHKDQLKRSLSIQRQTDIAHGLSELLDEVYVPSEKDTELQSAKNQLIVLVPATGPLNFAATVAYSAYLKDLGVPHTMLGEKALAPDVNATSDFEGARLVCICYLSSPNRAHHEYLLRRLNMRKKDLPVIGVSWQQEDGKAATNTPSQATVAIKHALETAAAG